MNLLKDGGIVFDTRRKCLSVRNLLEVLPSIPIYISVASSSFQYSQLHDRRTVNSNVLKTKKKA